MIRFQSEANRKHTRFQNIQSTHASIYIEKKRLMKINDITDRRKEQKGGIVIYVECVGF